MEERTAWKDEKSLPILLSMDCADHVWRKIEVRWDSGSSSLCSHLCVMFDGERRQPLITAGGQVVFHLISNFYLHNLFSQKDSVMYIQTYNRENLISFYKTVIHHRWSWFKPEFDLALIQTLTPMQETVCLDVLGNIAIQKCCYA